nr:2-hydroxycarboxylate transporter family protein [Sedimentibacter sp.]
MIVLIASKFELLPEGFMGSFAFLMAIGGILSWIGVITPIIREIGGFLFMPLFGALFLYKAGLLPEAGMESAQILMSNGLQMFFVSAIVVGSILSMDRKLLLSSVLRYIPVLLITQIFAIVFAFLAAIITGTSIYDAVFFIAAPCMTGGSSGAIATLPALYSSILGKDVSSLGGTMLAVAMIGEYIAVIFVVVMKVLAEKFPNAMGNGHGQLLKKESDFLKEARKNWVQYEDSSLDYSQLGAGLFVTVAIMTCGVVLSGLIPQIVYIAWAIIICIGIKAINILPDSICRTTNYWGQFAIKNILIILVTALGLSSMGSVSMSSAFSISTLVIIVITFIGAVLGSILASHLFGLYRYEGSLTAAMCACNIGASGDLQMLVLSDRVNLLAFATISTRIGGGLMLIEISIIFPIVSRALGII